jgi:flagellar basal-body rod protein FlgB
MTITTERMELMSRLMDVSNMRQDVIAQNIANVNTPGYRTLGVNFEDALKSALTGESGTSPRQIVPEIVVGAGGLDRPDGNNVDIDLEIARMQKNAVFFKLYSQLVAHELAQHRSAISGR